MPETLLKTKLYIPPLRPNLVSRPHLIERLNQGIAQSCKLTLVSAPAGFGKTTLVSEWVAGNERPAAWLSLCVGNNDNHVIDAKPVNNALTFTVGHLPPQAHLVFATREDPHYEE